MTAGVATPSLAHRVLVWAPRPADAEILYRTLLHHGFEAVPCVRLQELCQAIADGAAAAVIAEEALNDRALTALTRALTTQPTWSDFPLVILTVGRVAREPHRLNRILERIGQATLLERPVHTLSLVSAVRVAMRSRERQYQLRDRLQEIEEKAASLEAAERRAVSSARAKSEFLATMSHEIRTPMTAILGYAELLSASLTDDGDRQTLATIRRNGDYLLALLNDILDITKIEAGRFPLWKERFAPAELLAEVCQLMEIRAKARGLELRLECDGPLPDTIYTDRKRLRQVLVNVIGNAVKFTQSGSIRVTCGLDRTTAQPRLEIGVTDTGVGMTPGELAEAFDPFSRAGAGRDLHVPGTGLGLSISKRLIDLLDGEIEAESEPGKGSTFVIRIPTGSLKNARWVTGAPALETAAAPSDVSGRLEGHVLVVDDHPDVRELARHFLEGAGARVTSASDGESALAQHDATREGDAPFDAVVLDMQMPVLDGFGTARALRARGYRGPILALTAAAMAGDREKCLEAGCDAHVTKPLSRQTLIDTLVELVRARRRGSEPVEAETRTGWRVLLVEDDRDARTSFGLLLKGAGHDVESACDGRSALELAESFRPEAVLLDIGLPDISGYEVASRLRNIPSLEGTLLIGLTGRAEEGEDPALKERFDAYLLKPATVDDVEKVLAGRGA